MTTTATAAPATIETEHLAAVALEFEQMQMFDSPFGLRTIAVLERGTIVGPRIDGTVLRGGGDWLLIGADGVARVDVRATMQIADGTHVFMTNTGRVVLGDDARERFLAGETLHADEMYAMTALLFETASEEHGWLNRLVTIDRVVELSLRHIRYEAFEVR
jgi:hypothetical protein